MMSANEHIDELLSGFLDGKLNAEELRELKLAMSKDAGLDLKLERLREIGNDLRSLPQRRLGPNFSDRVVAAALSEARMLGVPVASQDYVGTALNQLGPPQRAEGLRRVLAAAFTIAASLLCAAYFSGWFAGSNDLVGPGDHLAVDASVVVGGEQGADAASAETPGQRPEAGLVEAGSVEAGGALVRNDPRSKDRMRGSISPQVLSILEVRPTADAWQQDLVAKLLRESGIAWSSPITVSKEIVDVLNDTRSINQGLTNQHDDSIAIVLVRAGARTLDDVMTKIWRRVDDFPAVFFDMAFDLPGSDLVQKLTSAQQSAVTADKAIATPIVTSAKSVQNLAEATEFSSKPRATYASKEMRARPLVLSPAGVPNADDEHEITYLLLVIRKPLP